MQIDSTIIYHKGILKDKKSPRIKNGIETPESQEDTETGVWDAGYDGSIKKNLSARKSNIKSKSENIVTLTDRFT